MMTDPYDITILIRIKRRKCTLPEKRKKKCNTKTEYIKLVLFNKTLNTQYDYAKN